VQQRIIKANIDKFKSLLEIETDPTKRAMLIRLLDEEEAKQRKYLARQARPMSGIVQVEGLSGWDVKK
jgi:hypothetical protein